MSGIILLSQTFISIEATTQHKGNNANTPLLPALGYYNMGEEGLEPSRGITPIDPKSILSTKFQHPPFI